MALDYYSVLQVSYNASPEEVKLAYRRLAKMYHPDANADDTEKAEIFKVVSEAYKVLSDEDKKAAYDLRLLLGVYDDYHPSDVNYTYDARTRSFRYRYYRRRDPVTYSKKTYAAVSLFIAFIASAIWAVPVSLTWYSSAYNYEKAVEYYQQGQYFTALNTLDRAINDFGSKNTEACMLAATILMNHFGQYSYAMEYTNRGFSMAKTDREKAGFLYVKALCLKAGANYYTAIQQLEEAKMLEPRYDSLYYAMANIQAFHLDSYAPALENYNTLLQMNGNFADAYYGRAYTYFKQGENQKALVDINRYLSYNIQNGKAYLLKGELELRSGHREEACHYIKKASLTHAREANLLQKEYCE